MKQISLQNRIYVNRNIKMENVKAIGFDLDYTLCVYKKYNFENLAYRETIKKLVKEKGYPKTLLDLVYSPNRFIRGLLIDTKKGNVLKLTKFNYVARAINGESFLSYEERKALYKNAKIIMPSKSLHAVDTLFSIPEVYLFSQLVEMKKRKLLDNTFTYGKIFRDIRECLDKSHQDASIKNKVINNRVKYIAKDLRLRKTLKYFKTSGRKIFLITNSNWEYTDAVMSFILGEKTECWVKYFDIINVDAKKPVYFTKKNSFKSKDRINNSIILVEGNYHNFENILGVKGENVLYIGDNIYGDMLLAKRWTSWRSAMIIEELTREVEIKEKLRNVILRAKKLDEERAKIDYEVLTLYLQIERLKIKKKLKKQKGDFAKMNEDAGMLHVMKGKITKLEMKLKKTIDDLEESRKKIEDSFNKDWGELFREKEELSWFGDQMRNFVCLYTGKVTNFYNYPLNKYFKTPTDFLPHEKN